MLRKKYFLFAGIVPENDPETSSGQDDKQGNPFLDLNNSKTFSRSKT
jgi:hypothetical protein